MRNTQVIFQNTDSYSIVRQLSQGQTSEVFEIQMNAQCSTAAATMTNNTTNTPAPARFALKRYKNDFLHHTAQEHGLLANVHHPHIMRVHGIAGEGQLVVELLANGELFDLVQRHTRLSEKVARRYFLQLLSAVKHLHDNGIAHRDLKLENIMLDGEYNLKVIDFGYAMRYDRGERCTQIVGTDTYMPPEMHAGLAYDPEKADVFACGVILFSMLYGIPPYLNRAVPNDPYYRFFCMGRQNVYWSALRTKLKLDITDQFADLINKMLAPDPNARFTFAQVLKHAWVREAEEDCAGAYTISLTPDLVTELQTVAVEPVQNN